MFNFHIQKSLVIFAGLSLAAFADESHTPSYVEGDGAFSLQCSGQTPGSVQENIFYLTAMYDENSPRKGFDLISDENLASGNGDFVYRVEISQTPHDGSEISSAPEVIPGCEFAPFRMSMNDEETESYISFECDADGDAGFGDLTIDMENEDGESPIALGHITFPEGQRDITFPFSEDTTIDVSCDFL